MRGVLHSRLARKGMAVIAGLALALFSAAPAMAATTIGSNISTDGDLTVNGNATLGDAAADLITINGTLQGGLVFEGSTSDANDLTFAITDPTAARTITFQDASGVVAVGTAGNALSFVTTAATSLTLPTTGTLTTLTGTETFTNKTLTSPKIGTAVLDANGVAIIALTPAGSAVNYVNIGNSAASAPVAITAAGSDTNISMYVQPKGTGGVIISNGVTNADQLILKAQTSITTAGNAGTLTSADLTANHTWSLPNADGTIALTSDLSGYAASGTNSDITQLTGLTGSIMGMADLASASGGTYFFFQNAIGAENWLTIYNAASGGSPRIVAAGATDANIDLLLESKGTGVVKANGVAVATVSGTQTLTNKTLTSPVIASISNTGTLTLPTSTDTLVGRATTDTLTNKTLTSPAISGATYSTALVTAGTPQDQANATALTGDYNLVTTGVAGDGVILPAASAGMVVRLVNQSANAGKLYANGTDTVNGNAGATGVTLPANSGATCFVAPSGIAWWCYGGTTL